MLSEIHDGRSLAEARYVFEKGRRQGEAYDIDWVVCHNPVCPCSHLQATFSAEGSEAPPEAELRLNLDIWREDLGTEPHGPAAASFARDLLADLSAADWHSLRTVFFSLKLDLTRKADLASLEDVDFPRQEIEDEGLLIGYREIVPYDERTEIEVGGQLFEVEDQYCLRARCSCNAVHLFFMPVPEGFSDHDTLEDSDRDTYVELDLGTGRWQIREQGRLPVDGAAMMAELLRRYDVVSRFGKRHRTLRAMYRNFRRRIGRSATPPGVSLARSAKAGRNDPCPCGSGKKYKKCCLRQDLGR